MKTLKRYSPIERERAVRLVFDQQHQHSSQWSAIESIASKIGCTAETLRRWVRQSETDKCVDDYCGLTPNLRCFSLTS